MQVKKAFVNIRHLESLHLNTLQLTKLGMKDSLLLVGQNTTQGTSGSFRLYK